MSSDQLNPILKAFGHEEKVAKNILIIGKNSFVAKNFIENYNYKLKMINLMVKAYM